jgi:peptidoglycan hydrolase CwlO-like protein
MLDARGELSQQRAVTSAARWRAAVCSAATAQQHASNRSSQAQQAAGSIAACSEFTGGALMPRLWLVQKTRGPVH